MASKVQDEASQVIVPEMGAMPSDAYVLADIVEQRFKDLIKQPLTPKELTDALKAATDWYKVKSDREQGDGYGSKLGRGTMREEA